jgi:arylformamidase
VPTRLSSESDPVFLSYTQAELDAQYDQPRWNPNGQATVASYTKLTEAARQLLGAPETHRYGAGPAEVLDLYRTEQPNAPIHVFVHGGAWRHLGRGDSGFAAPSFVAAGAHFVALDFSLLPGPDLTDVLAELQRAIAWLYGRAATFGGDPARIHLSGHSSGAHLAACLLVADWSHYAVPPDVLRSGLLVGGLYDLAPVRLSFRNAYVGLTPETESQLSPQRHLNKLACPVALFRSERESAEFARQTDEFATTVAPAGHLVCHEIVVGRSHLETALDLADPESRVGRMALQLMELEA